MAWMRSGTITVQNGSDQVVGSGTNWAQDLVSPGDALIVGGHVLEVASFQTATALTLRVPFPGSNGSGLDYAIAPTRAPLRELQKGVNELTGSISTRVAAVEGTTATTQAQVTAAYRSDRVNDAIRTGSDNPTNWDGLTFDDTTNTFVMKADAVETGTDPGASLLELARLRLRGDGSVSSSGTAHGLEIGAHGGDGVKFDRTGLLARDGGSDFAVEYRDILQRSDVRYEQYLVANAPDGWLIAENFAGDTSVGLDAVSARLFQTGDLTHLTFELTFSSMSIPVDGDADISTYFDLAALGAATGWFATIEAGNLGQGIAQLRGNGFDQPWFPVEVNLNSNGHASFPNTFRLRSEERPGTSDPGANATEMIFRTSIMARVA